MANTKQVMHPAASTQDPIADEAPHGPLKGLRTEFSYRM